MDAVGYKVDVEKDMKPLFEKLSKHDRKVNGGEKNEIERKSENFFKKHPFLEF